MSLSDLNDKPRADQSLSDRMRSGALTAIRVPLHSIRAWRSRLLPNDLANFRKSLPAMPSLLAPSRKDADVSVPGQPPRFEDQPAQIPVDGELLPQVGPRSLPLTTAQRGMWVGQKIAAPGTVFNLAEAIEIHGAIDAGRFVEALRRVSQEAETVRITIVEDSSGPRQVIQPRYDREFPVMDVSAEPEPFAAAEAWMGAELRKPVDFRSDALWVSALFKLGPDHFIWYHRAHHIMMDGFSGGLIGRRVAELYSALVENRAPAPCDFEPLSSLLENERDYLSSDRATRDRDFWVKHLAGLPEPVSLARKRVPGFGGLLRETAYLPAEKRVALQALAKASNASLPQVLIALAGAFLFRATGASDLIFGMPVTGRTSGRLRRIPGMSANAVSIRLSFSATMTLDDLIQQVSRTTRQALRHQQYRYENLRHDLGLMGAGQQVSWLAVNIEPFDYDLRFGGHRSTIHNLSNGSVEDLTVFVYDRGTEQDLRVDFDANPALYSSAELADHQTRFLRFIESLVADPEQRIGLVDILTPDERKRLLVGWNDTERLVGDAFVIEQFEAQAERSPDSVAVEAEGRRVTYREVNDHANLLARLLIDWGVGPDDIVAVLLPRTVAMPVALLALLKAGAAYLPLDPEMPAARLATILDDAKPAVIVTTRDIAGRLALGALPCLFMDEAALGPGEWRGTRNPTDADRIAALSPTDTAYVIYTSGSTGQPKGVRIQHRNLANFLAAMQDELALTPADRWLAVTTLAFDIAALEIFAPLLAGARVVIAGRDTVRDPASLAALIRSSEITIAQATPALWQLLVLGDTSVFDRLRVLVGGEALSSRLAQTLRRLGARVTNLYGPTETTIWSTSLTLQDEDLVSPPIGRPIWNTRTYVVDSALQPVPVGVVGDLLIGGDGVAEGYLKRPALTAERFIPDPYGHPGSRLYRTGDLARWRPNGTLEFIGRSDHQIKIRGFRIEAGEIEAALLRQPHVERAVVTPWIDAVGDKRLVAYLVAAPGAELDSADLRRALADSLSDYMVPSDFVILDALPTTPNGKIDRKALPAPERRTKDYVAPRTPTETALAALWATRLGLPQVGITDNFFDLGGNSLKAAQLIAEIQTAFSTELSLAALFEASTVAELAAHLESGAQRDPLAALLPIRAQGGGAPLFCIHPVLGLSWGYTGLLRYLPGDHPVYGLQARGLAESAEAMPASIEEMAADYLRLIRAVQPHGPYHLLGWSLGGLVAVAMTEQLEWAGEEVAFLSLLDSYPFVQRDGAEIDEGGSVTAALAFLGYDAAALPPAERTKARLAAFLCDVYDIPNMPLVQQITASRPDILATVTAVIENNLSLARRYVPGRIEADILFFRAQHGKGAELDGLLHHEVGAWGAHVAGFIDRHDLACHHQDMLNPEVLDQIGHVVAQVFGQRLRGKEPVTLQAAE